MVTCIHTGQRMVLWCIWLSRLTLVCEVIRCHLVQVRQNQKKDCSGWQPAIAFFYLFLFRSLLHLTYFFLQKKILRVEAWSANLRSFQGGREGRAGGFRVKLILFISLGFCEVLWWPFIVLNLTWAFLRFQSGQSSSLCYCRFHAKAIIRHTDSISKTESLVQKLNPPPPPSLSGVSQLAV